MLFLSKEAATSISSNRNRFSRFENVQLNEEWPVKYLLGNVGPKTMYDVQPGYNHIPVNPPVSPGK